MKTLSHKLQLLSPHIFPFAFIFFLSFIPKSSEAIDPDTQLRVFSWAGYSYDHPYSAELSALYLPEMFHDGDVMDLNQIQGVANISFDLTFLVNDDIHQWDLNMISLKWGDPLAGAFYDVTSTVIDHDGQAINALHINIHNPYGFFSIIRPYFEFPPQGTGTPVAVVEGSPGIYLYGDECGWDPFIYDECTSISPIIENPSITLTGSAEDQLASIGYDSEICSLTVYFPPCELEVYDPEGDGPNDDDGGDGDGPDHGNDPLEGKSLILEEDNFSVDLFPNPAISYVEINLEGETESMTIELMDSQGRVLKTQPGRTKSKNILELEKLTPGVYYVRISSGRFTETRKLLLM